MTITGWWQRRREEREAAERARLAAQKRLDATRRQGARADSAADRFAELIEQALRGGAR